MFDQKLGDLDLELYDAGGNLLASSATTDDFERISLAGRAAGTYYLRARGFRGATNPGYRLQVSAPVRNGVPDWAEPNDTRPTARHLRIDLLKVLLPEPSRIIRARHGTHMRPVPLGHVATLDEMFTLGL